MMNTLDQLEKLSQEDVPRPFAPYQEEAIISLALDHPEFFSAAARFMKPDMFSGLPARWLIAEILNSFEQFQVVPTRKWLKAHLEQKMTEDDPHEEVLGLVDRKSDPREIPLVKDTLLKWAKDRAYGMLYADDAVEAYHRGDFAYLEQIVNEANRIADVNDKGFWFFENLELLFQPDVVEHRTTGFPRLDRLLNNGGPSAKEVVCWLAATNVGKCHSARSKIIEERLSRIYELELENGTIIEIRGSREVQTNRGRVKVADLTISDELTEVPIGDDSWDLELPDL